MSNPAEPVTALGNGAFRVARADGTQAAAYAVAEGARTWVFLDGRTFVIESSGTRRTAAPHDAAALAAPMPATVTQIHVTSGQSVHAGDLLLTLEAMKMELPIRATANGTITAVNCRIGELVQPGIALLEIEPRTPNPEPRTPNTNQEPSTENREPQ